MKSKTGMEKKSIYNREKDEVSLVQFGLRIVPKTILLVIRGAAALALLPIYWIGRLVYYRPPNVPYLGQLLRYLRHAWTVSPDNPENKMPLDKYFNLT